MIDVTEDLIQNLDEKVKAKTNELEHLNIELTDSIEYASLIQSAIIPPIEKLQRFFDDSFAIWKPKGIVGGDIYLFEELRSEDEAILMVIDCTGHGVPGAFVTMLVKAIEKEITTKIIKSDYDVLPSIILKHFNRTMKKLLRQESNDALSNVGFDGGIIYINKKDKIIKYSGAQLSLFVIQDNKLEILKGDKHSIGYKKSNENFEFKDDTINIDRDTYVYITTDGYIDQTGGDKGLMFGKKRLLDIILNNYELDFDIQQTNLIDIRKDYMRDLDTKDDTTVIGFKIKG